MSGQDRETNNILNALMTTPAAIYISTLFIVTALLTTFLMTTENEGDRRASMQKFGKNCPVGSVMEINMSIEKHQKILSASCRFVIGKAAVRNK